MNEQRLVDIETKIAYQERTIKELNEVVCQQQNQIDRLNATCKLLANRNKESSETSKYNLIDDRPPHY